MAAQRTPRARAKQRIASYAFGCVALLAHPGHASHAPLVPEPRTILLQDGHPEHVVIGTRRGGYFVTRDGGATWSWICEAGVGYDDEEVYPGTLLGTGKLVVSTGFGGVAVSSDGCGWSPWLPSPQPFVADVRSHADARDTVIVLEGRSDGASFVNQLWQSQDDAQTWQPLGAPFAPDTLAVSFAVSNSGTLYVAAAGPSGAELLRSDDSAVGWARTTIASELGVTPRVIGAHDGAGAPHVYVLADYAQGDGLTTPGDRVLMSLDRGESFSPLLEAVGDLAAWSLSQDGERLAVGGESDGILLLTDASSASAGATLTRVSAMEVHALAWGSDGRLYAGGHEAEDGFSVGVSTDDGHTFSPLFARCQVDAPLSCPLDTTVGALCLSSGETGWDVRKEVAAATACANGGAAGAAGGTSGLPADPDSGAGRSGSSMNSEATSSQTSSCAASPSHGTGGTSFLLVALAVGGVLARRRASLRLSPTADRRRG